MVRGARPFLKDQSGAATHPHENEPVEVVHQKEAAPGDAEEIFQLAWECFGVPREKLEEVSGKREVWTSLLRVLPL